MIASLEEITEKTPEQVEALKDLKKERYHNLEFLKRCALDDLEFS